MDERFDGAIAGVGTAAGLRVVLGHWPRSPYGAFADVMVETAQGHRMLLAPTQEIADFVAGTYRFDEVRVVPVDVEVSAVEPVPAGLAEAPIRQGVDRDGAPTPGPARWHVSARPLEMEFEVAGRRALGELLRAVPRWLATWPAWITLTDVVASRVLPGVRTRGSACGGRREYYGALDLHAITAATVRWEGVDQGALTGVHPPVRFGFGSTPREPSLARVVTVVRT